jgi:integrase
MEFERVARGVLATQPKDPRMAPRVEFWIHRFAGKDIADISVDDVDQAIESIAARGKLRHVSGQGIVPTGEPISGSTLNRYISALSYVYKHARRLKITPKTLVNPTRLADKGQEGEGRIIHIKREEAERIIDAAGLVRWHKFRAFVAVAMSTGARLGNLQTLTWRDVDRARGVLYFPTSKNGRPYSAALSPRATKELAAIKSDIDSDTTPVFGKRTFRKSWTATLALAGVEYFPFHGCRHVAASLLSAAGTPLIGVMAQLNHKTTSMALRYQHANVEQQLASVAKAWS